jgi:single-strand selective monofunctional uracil DNA glycosylase
MKQIIDDLLNELLPLSFSEPITHVYNPLIYARANFIQYWSIYGRPPKEVIFLGMNPGPWGMAQTGIPFGHVELVEKWIGINGSVAQPAKQHPRRPIQGFQCQKREVSGQRLWGWAQSRFKTPQQFFRRFWVANYCPLVFMEESGRNRTPDKLPKKEKNYLYAACDKALMRTVDWLQPRYVIGVGAFAAKRAGIALNGSGVNVGQILHPSPANPKANAGWAQVAERQLAEMGIEI